MKTQIYNKEGVLLGEHTHQKGVAFEDACNNVYRIKALADNIGCPIGKIVVESKKEAREFVFSE